MVHWPSNLSIVFSVVCDNFVARSSSPACLLVAGVRTFLLPAKVSTSSRVQEAFIVLESHDP